MKNKLLRALLSVAIGVGVWLYVVTVVAPNTDKTYNNIPVVVQGEVLLHDRQLMITEMGTEFVDLQLEGSRLDLNKLSSSNIAITVDASRIYEAGTHNVLYSIAYPGDVPSNAITVLNKNPSTVTVKVEDRITKEVPVKVNFSGNLPENFVADTTELNVEQINIVGPRSVVEKIVSAQIQMDLEGRSESFSGELEYILCDKDNKPVDARQVTTDAANVMVNLKIMRVKEIALVVNVIYGGGATEQTSQVTVEPATIRVSGSDNLLEGLEQLELGTLDLGEMPADEVLKFPIKLPEGINNETGVAEATVDVKFPGLVTKTLTVTEITAINVPEGMKVEMITEALEIQLRGPESQIENLKAEDITVTVDFTGAQPGTVKLKPEIAGSTPEVGAVGTYTVSATVREEA